MADQPCAMPGCVKPKGSRWGLLCPDHVAALPGFLRLRVRNLERDGSSRVCWQAVNRLIRAHYKIPLNPAQLAILRSAAAAGERGVTLKVLDSVGDHARRLLREFVQDGLLRAERDRTGPGSSRAYRYFITQKGAERAER